jgi:hypothetical protein
VGRGEIESSQIRRFVRRKHSLMVIITCPLLSPRVLEIWLIVCCLPIGVPFPLDELRVIIAFHCYATF